VLVYETVGRFFMRHPVVLYLVMNTKRIKEHFTYSTFVLFFKLLDTLKNIYTKSK